MHDRLERYHGNQEDGFEHVVAPFFQRVWPKETIFQDPEQTHDVVRLIVAAGEEFPEALKILRPYIRPTSTTRTGLYLIAKSDVPRKFPHEALELIWIICGQHETGYYYDLADLIDKLIEADPTLEADRRLQWLELLAERF